MDSDMTEAFSFGSDIVPSRAEQTAPLTSRLWGRDDRIPREEAVSFLAEVRSEATADAAADDALFFKGGRGGRTEEEGERGSIVLQTTAEDPCQRPDIVRPQPQRGGGMGAQNGRHD